MILFWQKNKLALTVLIIAVLGFALVSEGGILQYAGGGTTLSLDEVQTKWSDSRFEHAYLITYAADGKGEYASGKMLEDGDALPNGREVTEDVSFKIAGLDSSCVYEFEKTSNTLKKPFLETKDFGNYWLASEAREKAKDWCNGLGGHLVNAKTKVGGVSYESKQYACWWWEDYASTGEFTAKKTLWSMDFAVTIGDESKTKTVSSSMKNVNFDDLAYVHVPGGLTTGLACDEYSSSKLLYTGKWDPVNSYDLQKALSYQSGTDFARCVSNIANSFGGAIDLDDFYTCSQSARKHFNAVIYNSNSFTRKISKINSTNSGGYYGYDSGADKTIIPLVQVYVNAEKISSEGLIINVPVNTPTLSNCAITNSKAEAGDPNFLTADLGSKNDEGGNFIVTLTNCDTSLYGLNSKTYTINEGETRSIVLKVNNANVIDETCTIQAYSASDSSLMDTCSVSLSWTEPSVTGNEGAACLRDSDCGEGYSCINNVCEKNESLISLGNEFMGVPLIVWLLALLIGGGVIWTLMDDGKTGKKKTRSKRYYRRKSRRKKRK